MSSAQLRRLRWAVRAVLVLGIAASVAANVLHAQPNPIAQAIAAWPPLALLLTVELIARVPVHRRSLAAARLAATATIAGIAAWVSYWHMAGVAARYGETGPAPYLIPLSVDGLVVIASISLVELNGRLRDAGSAPAVDELQAVNPTPDHGPIMQASPAAEPEQSDTADQPVDDREIDPARRRAAAVAALLQPGADVAAIAATAGVTVETVQRWATTAATRARRPRGGTRKPAPIEGATA